MSVTHESRDRMCSTIESERKTDQPAPSSNYFTLCFRSIQVDEDEMMNTYTVVAR